MPVLRRPAAILQPSSRPCRLPRCTPSPPAWTRTYATPTTEQHNRTAIVTGSARGIGRAIALRLARDGYDLCINDVTANASLADHVVSEIKALGRNAIPAIADVTSQQDVENMIEISTNALGPLNVMVANAGIAQVKSLLHVTVPDFRRMFDINVLGVFNCYTAAAKQMIKQGEGGKIIGAASVVAFKPFALLGHYSASKWAVRGLTQACAMELAEHKITVNAYAPGIVGTAMWDLIDEEMGKKSGAKKGDTFKRYCSQAIALQRPSVPEDVSSLVSYLCSRDSDYVTGQTMIVDGGIEFS